MANTQVVGNEVIPGIPDLPKLRGNTSTISTTVNKATSIGSSYQLVDEKSTNWSSVKVRIYSGGPKLTLNVQIPTVEVQGNGSGIIFLTGPMPDVERALNNITFLAFAPDQFKLKITVEPSIKFFSKGYFYYFNRLNGHYYRYVSRQEAEVSTRTEMAAYAKKLKFAGATPYLATFGGYGVWPYQRGDTEHEFTFILYSGILTDNKNGRSHAPIALTAGMRCGGTPTQFQINQGSCPNTSNNNAFYWMPGSDAPNLDLSLLKEVQRFFGYPWYPNEPNYSGNILVTAGWSTENKNFVSKYQLMDVIIPNSFVGGAIANVGIGPSGRSFNSAQLWDDIPDLPNYFDGAILEYGKNDSFEFGNQNTIERTVVITGQPKVAPIGNEGKAIKPPAKATSTPKSSTSPITGTSKAIINNSKEKVKRVSVTCLKGMLKRKFSSSSCPPGWRKS
jgi:hypothetical protein